MRFKDSDEFVWHFFHNPEWDLSFPAVYACEFKSGKRRRYGCLLWRNRIWVVEEGKFPIWAQDLLDWPISRESAIEIFPGLGDVNLNWEIREYDELHLADIISGNYPPDIPKRFDLNQDFDEFGHRFDRALEILDALNVNDAARQNFWNYETERLEKTLWDLDNDQLFEVFLLTKFFQNTFTPSTRMGEQHRRNQLATRIIEVIERRIALRSEEVGDSS